MEKNSHYRNNNLFFATIWGVVGIDFSMIPMCDSDPEYLYLVLCVSMASVSRSTLFN